MSELRWSEKHIKNQLTKANLINSDFTIFQTTIVSIFIKKMFNLKYRKQYCKNDLITCFKIMKIFQKSHIQQIYLKQLCFIHLTIQKILSQSKYYDQVQLLIQILSERTQQVMQSSRSKNGQNSDNKRKLNTQSGNDRQRSYSKEAISWIKNKFSASKQKTINRSPQKDTNNARKNRITSLMETRKDNSKIKRQERNTSPFPERKHLESNISSLQILLQKNLLQPYAAYLLKILNTKGTLHDNNEGHNSSERIWHLLNIFTKIIQATQYFGSIIRYSSKNYQPMVISIIKILDYDIKSLYAELTNLINKKKVLIDYAISKLSEYQKNSQILRDQQTKIYNQYELVQFKEIINQVAVINQGLCCIYFNKYIFKDLIAANLKPPSFISTTGIEYDLILMIVSKYQKRQRSNSKQSHKKKTQKQTDMKKTLPNSVKFSKPYNPALRERNKLKIEKIRIDKKQINDASQHSSQSSIKQVDTNATKNFNQANNIVQKNQLINRFQTQITFRKTHQFK